MVERERQDRIEEVEMVLAMLEAGCVTIEDVRRANAWRHERYPPIGKLAMTQRKLTMAQVFEVLGQQAVAGGRFGNIAVQLGFLDKSELYDLLELQTSIRPTLTDALIALDLITSEQAKIFVQQAKSWSAGPYAAAILESSVS